MNYIYQYNKLFHNIISYFLQLSFKWPTLVMAKYAKIKFIEILVSPFLVSQGQSSATFSLILVAWNEYGQWNV